MRDISLHILDIAQNSLTAKASCVEISITANTQKDILTVHINDNGKGIEKEKLLNITSPFTTSRITRSVGMGLPLLKQAAEITGGCFEISSTVNKGTEVKAEFVISSIDRVPLGDLAETAAVLINNPQGAEIVLTIDIDDRKFIFDTKQIKSDYDLQNFDNMEIRQFLKEYLKENIEFTKGGALL